MSMPTNVLPILLVGVPVLFALFAVFQVVLRLLSPREEWESRWRWTLGYLNWLARDGARRETEGDGPQDRGRKP